MEMGFQLMHINVWRTADREWFWDYAEDQGDGEVLPKGPYGSREAAIDAARDEGDVHDVGDGRPDYYS